MNEIIWQSALVIAAYLMGFFTGQSRLKCKITEAKADANNDGWNSCEIHLRDRYHLHRKRKGSK